MDAASAITLPHGAVAQVRAPTGADEAWLLDEAGRGTPAALAGGLLERCVISLDGVTATGEALGALTAGDREALLLHVRTAAFGRRLACVVDCPACGEALDVEPEVGDLLVASGAGASAREAAGVAFRVPTGADLEAAARAADPGAGADVLLDRCTGGARLTGAERDAVVAAMAAADPQAEVVLTLRCPACDAEVAALLDAGAVVIGELTAGARRLFEEVRALAAGFGWGEAEILALAPRRRRRYLDVLAEEALP